MLISGDKSFEHNGYTLEHKWTIKKIPGLVLWLEPSTKNIVYGVDGRVNTWRDTSGKLNSAFQADVADMPLLSPTLLNNRNYMVFDDDKCLVTSLNLDTFTIFTVCYSDDNQFVYEYGDPGSTTGFYLSGDANSILVRNGSSASAKNAGYNWNMNKGWRILSHFYGGTHSTHSLRVNNSSVYLTNYLGYTGNPGNLGASQNFYIGSQATGNGFNGGLAEMAVFDRKLEQFERDMVHIYLSSKYGI